MLLATIDARALACPATAGAPAPPQPCASESTPTPSTACRFRRMSRAASGMAARSCSSASTSGHLERGLARLPVARAELAGLQRVQYPQHLVDVAAHREVVDAGPADHALRIHDEGGPERHALAAVQDAERGRQLALGVGHHRERQALEIGVIAPPREVDEVGVVAHAEHLRIAVLEIAVPLAELDDLGRADEREVHRPGEEDQPAPGIAPVGDLREFTALLEADGGLQVALGETVANGQHIG